MPLNKNKQEFFISSVWFLWQIISLQTFLSIYLGCSLLINIFHSICVKISVNISYFLLLLYFFELIFRYLPILLCVLSNNCIQKSNLVNFSRKLCSTQLYFLWKYSFLNRFFAGNFNHKTPPMIAVCYCQLQWHEKIPRRVSIKSI